MRSGAFFFFLFLAPLSAAAESFCLQTFNVYGPAYASGTTGRLTRLAADLAQEKCEIVQLQELWKESQYEILDRALAPAGWESRRADALPEARRTIIGLGTFARYPIAAARRELFKVNNGDGLFDRVRGLSGVQKGFTVITVDQSGAALTLVNAHTHPTDVPTRLAQMIQLAASLYADPALAEQPLLFTADLNATPASLEYAVLRDILLLRDGYAEAHGGYGKECTYCADNPYSWSRENRVIDFTLFRDGPAYALRANASAINLTGYGRPLSDHYGVRTDLAGEARADGPLAPESERAQARRAAALATAEKVIQILRKSGDQRMNEARAWAEGFAGRLRAGNLLPAEARVFLTP